MLIYIASFFTSAVLLGLDQWLKFWTDSNMTLGETAPLFGSLLELHYVRNYGVAWSLFSNMRWILVGVTGFIIIAVAAVIMLRLIRRPIGIFAAFLILGGGIGNLLDRIFLGYVIDMLRFPFWKSYPTFNIADICVVTGCILWLIYALFLPERDSDRTRRNRRGAGSRVQAQSQAQADAKNSAQTGSGDLNLNLNHNRASDTGDNTGAERELNKNIILSNILGRKSKNCVPPLLFRRGGQGVRFIF